MYLSYLPDWILVLYEMGYPEASASTANQSISYICGLNFMNCYLKLKFFMKR